MQMLNGNNYLSVATSGVVYPVNPEPEATVNVINIDHRRTQIQTVR